MSSTSLNMACHSGRRMSILHLGFVVLMISTVAQGSNQRFCGRQLVSMLSMLCEEFPDLHGFSKKSMIDFDKADYSSTSSDEWLAAMLSPDQDMMMPSTDLMLPGVAAAGHNNLMMAADQQKPKVPLWMAMLYPQNYPFRTSAGSSAGSNDLIPPRFRKSPGGIVEECCMKPCGMKDLLRYCRVPAF